MTTAKSTTDRPVVRVVQAHRQLEGGGFPVRRPIPTQGLEQVDPFLLLDEMGPVDWPPGEAMGAPDHPHRGFETVTYLLEGRMQHQDSHGNRGTLGPGDVQWMTAGAGVVHSELPEPGFREMGGRMHGFQVWVNLPKRDKMTPPRYQEIGSARIPEATTEDGKVRVRVIAGESLGERAVIDTHTPIAFLHFTVQPGGALDQPVPADHEGFAYVFSGAAELGRDRQRVTSGEMAILGPGESLPIRVPADAAEPAELLLLTGVPLREPLARYGPFVMNAWGEIKQAMLDYQQGRMGRIPPRA